VGKTNPKGHPPSRLRIVAGIWRGRYLRVPPVPQVRPTPARVRETLSNWLAGELQGATCLDLYAGSGALGFEAASREARRVILVDHDPNIIRCLRAEVEKLQAEQVEVHCADALDYLKKLVEPIDIVFLDPPFSPDPTLLEDTCTTLAKVSCLKPTSRIYIEAPAKQHINTPVNWVRLKSRQAGQVGYHLFASQPEP